ncbi:hypothetical protein N7448_007927 [Penicillium atrosanguineum]|uniref:uncharacterized protein n=1 Tax=Penicillium atrosanguineum TaxID=1132637 RepID=UPI00238BB24C|nr:uncharacterized protein N7443_001051 [Penicillium atrosanguineum]KAJ5127148.1 hypothetical protein N7448_007927 [Penicillium atrosanguineum]KAJ5314167.1 hypothetical protein N7443_001051 [Penicillium atrosanguineum]
MDPSKAASSNVTVEYTDPYGLFPQIQPVLESKLPLKNLHWKSPTRPARSIESLRVGFTPAPNDPAERESSSDGAGTVPHRRHQIPGLRQTPYLKIYLLRCDDNDTYKATARKTLREWIKAQGSSSTSQTTGSSQEKHDAFEWLIVHVVQDGDGDKTPTTTSKWGRGTSTVLEKVKADFNGTSKTAVDRVAQLRLPREGAAKSPELADQLEDLIDKIKNGILASFDLRVAQYEEDIKEKDSQRSLPGWNFCTFFILKEGLARGFENVGLFDDALAGYDELSAGLDAAIREQLQGSGEQHSTTLLESSKICAEAAKKALENGAPRADGSENENSLEIRPEDFPLSSGKMPYREMILSSDISIFDFRTYVFSRQLTLQLRAARAPSLTAGDATKKEKKPEDLMLLSEICSRSTEFISLAARTLRYDLESGLTGVESDAKADVIHNMVSSWTYSAALQVLNQTFTPTLSLPESSLHAVVQSSDVSSSNVPATIPEELTERPRRSSSLISPPTSRSPRPVTQDMSDSIGLMQRRSTMEHPKPAPGAVQRTGSEQLASGRGELLLLARRSLEEAARRRGWSEKWNDLGLLFDDSHPSGTSGLAEVSLDDSEESKPQKDSEPKPSSLVGIEIPNLVAALGSKDTFLSLYEDLTDQIICHNMAANRTYSAQTALAEIAILRYRQADFESAASYFHQMAPFYGSKFWAVLEGTMLELYSRCLKKLERHEDYVRMMLKLLSKYASYSQSRILHSKKALTAPTSILEQEKLAGYVSGLFEGAGSLQKEISASLSDFFGDLHVDPAIQLYDDKDGFQVRLSLRFLLGPRVEIDSIKVRLISASNSEHWIEGSTKFVIKSTRTTIFIDSATTLQGKYIVDRLEMKSGNLVFAYHSGNQSALPVGFREADEAEEADQRPYIYCYPPPDGLQAKVVSPHLINLEAMRTLELELKSGRNNIESGTVRIRPATAGLRLRSTEVEVVEGELEVSANGDSGVIEFAHFLPRSSVRLRIPYTVEEAFTTLSARAEIGYLTEQGKFVFSTAHDIIATLPISVNVQDVFKDEVLFSRFTVSPAMLIPLRITNCSLPSSESFKVQSSITGPVALAVFPKQPASLLYKIRPSPTPRSASRSLRLRVDFTCIDDECFDAIQKLFVAAVESSQFAQYSTLFTSHLIGRFRDQLSTANLEVIGLVREVETLSYRSVRWEGLLGALKDRTEEMRQWLTAWHENNPVVRLPQQPTIPTRSIVIPVEIPEIQVVHTAELQLHPSSEAMGTGASHAAVGQMISAELTLHHTRRWCSPATQENSGQPLECSYELHANPELWLLGGRRRGNFLAREGEATRFTVLLLPQKPGHLLLPGLEVRTFAPSSSQPPTSPVAPDTASGGPVMPAQRRSIPSEVDYRNHGETMLVLPDLRKTTVSLSASGSPGGPWLVDSERRAEVH